MARITITFGKLRIAVYIKNNRRDLENSGGYIIVTG